MPRNQRTISSSDVFTHTIRRGLRAGGGTVVLYVLVPDYKSLPASDTRDVAPLPPADDLARYSPQFGLIVSKAVGNSVVRHCVSRQLRLAITPVLTQFPSGTTIVIRALPKAGTAPHSTLRADVQRAVAKIFRTISQQPKAHRGHNGM